MVLGKLPVPGRPTVGPLNPKQPSNQPKGPYLMYAYSKCSDQTAVCIH